MPGLRILAGAVALLPALASAAERPARPRLCPENLPEGVRLPVPPGCDRVERGEPRADGFRDLGGVSVRVGGRAAAEFSAGRGR